MDRGRAGPDDSRRRRRLSAGRSRLAAATVLLASVAACAGGGSDPETVRVGGVPVLEGSTRGPGTELGAGFTMVEGSVLLGTTFPSRTEYLDDGGFRALLLVTGPFREVFRAYARQAAAVDMPLAPDFGRAYCSPDRVYLCSGRAGAHPQRGRSAWVRAWRSPSRGPAPVSHLFLHYRDIGEDLPPVDRAPVRPDVGEAPETGSWPALPEVGEPIEPEDNQPPLRLVDGAQLVAHRGLGTCSPTTGSTIVLRTDEPDEVLDRIQEQHPGRDQGYEEAGTEDGAEVAHRSWHWGGGSYDAWSVTRPDEPTYLLIDRCPVD